MKSVFAETRVNGYLTNEDLYFATEQKTGIDSDWLAALTGIILDYAMKYELDLKAIQNILNE